jgi:hypothetical protein
MAKSLKELMEARGFDKDTQRAINEAWESRLAELREEFAQRYEHDKKRIAEAVERFTGKAVAEEISEFRRDRSQMVDQRVKYRQAVKKHAAVLDRFITESLAKEVRELREDRNNAKKRVSRLDRFVVEQLSSELKEFHADKQALAEERVKVAREGRRQLAESKRKFVKSSAEKIEKVVTQVVESEIKRFRKDIIAARENDFGRRIFEAFASEYGSTYLDSNAEMRRIKDTVTQIKRELQEARSEAANATKEKRIVEAKLNAERNRAIRKQKLDELTRPLGREKREIMVELLESVPTEKLTESFNKYLPSLMEGKPIKKTHQPLQEARTRAPLREHTGDRKAPAKAASNPQDLVELDQIRKLAGLSK